MTAACSQPGSTCDPAASDTCGKSLSTDVAELLTIIVTTSPVPHNPSTDMIQQTMRSLDLAPGAAACRKLIVCDGANVKARATCKKSWRQGVITEAHVPKYSAYKVRLHELAADGDPAFAHAEVIELDSKHGFGYAVRAALPHVHTPLVMVVQHDRTFMRPVDLHGVVAAVHTEADVHMAGFVTASTQQHALKMQSRNSSAQQPSVLRKADWAWAETPRFVGGVRLLPMLQWLDSTHIAKAQYYRDFVFNGQNVKRGGFIEDRLGNVMLDDLRAQGVHAHAKYGTWIVDDGLGRPMVAHLHGRGFLEAPVKAALAAGVAPCG